jgi:phosphoglycolate phosphatase-like HAD superfamily hydrolase
VHAVEAIPVVHNVAFAGRTDGAIARDLLLASGVEGDAIDARVEGVHQATCAAYTELCPDDLSATVTPGMPALLERLVGEPGRFRLSLVTGNFEAVARLKLGRAGVGRYFPEGQGGVGSDAEDRAELPRVARERAATGLSAERAARAEGAAAWPRERTVVIGDTPRDIACARADGVRVIAVTTGPFSTDALADADAICDSPDAVGVVLDDWA